MENKLANYLHAFGVILFLKHEPGGATSASGGENDRDVALQKLNKSYGNPDKQV